MKLDLILISVLFKLVNSSIDSGHLLIEQTKNDIASLNLGLEKLDKIIQDNAILLNLKKTYGIDLPENPVDEETAIQYAEFLISLKGKLIRAHTEAVQNKEKVMEIGKKYWNSRIKTINSYLAELDDQLHPDRDSLSNVSSFFRIAEILFPAFPESFKPPSDDIKKVNRLTRTYTYITLDSFPKLLEASKLHRFVNAFQGDKKLKYAYLANKEILNAAYTPHSIPQYQAKLRDLMVLFEVNVTATTPKEKVFEYLRFIKELDDLIVFKVINSEGKPDAVNSRQRALPRTTSAKNSDVCEKNYAVLAGFNFKICGIYRRLYKALLNAQYLNPEELYDLVGFKQKMVAWHVGVQLIGKELQNSGFRRCVTVQTLTNYFNGSFSNIEDSYSAAYDTQFALTLSVKRLGYDKEIQF